MEKLSLIVVLSLLAGLGPIWGWNPGLASTPPDNHY